MNTAAHAESGGSTLISIFVLLLAGISILTLVGMGAMMAINAIFSNRPLVTSWPADQEHAFAAFERRSSESSSRAWMVSLLGAAIVTALAVGIYFGVKPETHDLTKGMNMSNLTKKSETAKPAAAAPAAETPKEAPAEAPKAEGEAPK